MKLKKILTILLSAIVITGSTLPSIANATTLNQNIKSESNIMKTVWDYAQQNIDHSISSDKKSMTINGRGLFSIIYNFIKLQHFVKFKVSITP